MPPGRSTWSTCTLNHGLRCAVAELSLRKAVCISVRIGLRRIVSPNCGRYECIFFEVYSARGPECAAWQHPFSAIIDHGTGFVNGATALLELVRRARRRRAFHAVLHRIALVCSAALGVSVILLIAGADLLSWYWPALLF